MNAIGHVMGADLTLDGGGLALVATAQAVRERLLRRLCTNPGGYIWQPGYGAGLPAMIGAPVVADTIGSVVRAQMALEAGVDQTQPVQVSVSDDGIGTVQCAITYVDAATQSEQSLLVSG